MRMTIGASKGGVGKTTTAIYMALQLAQSGPTVLVDADRQGSASAWWRLAEREAWVWPDTLTLVPWTEPMTLPPMAHVVIDTGPGDVARFTDAVRLSDTVLVPSGARAADVAQVGETMRIVDALALRQSLSYGVVLTMVRLRTLAATEAPGAILSAGLPLIDTIIPLREGFAAAFGTVPLFMGAYGDLYRELTEEPAHAS